MRSLVVVLSVFLVGCGDDEPPRPAAVEMIKIPGGTFKAGCDPAQVDDPRAGLPWRTVTVAAFEIDRTEVTVEAYTRCYRAGPCRDAGDRVHAFEIEMAKPGTLRPIREPEPLWGGTDPLDPDLPIWDVSAEEARAYCAWAGKRLPTELEWERAARGDDGRPYPWGTEPADCERAAYLDCPRKRSSLRPMEDIVHPVGSLPRGASPYGVLDMVGNVAEWAEPADGNTSRAVALGGIVQHSPKAYPSSLVLGRRAEVDARSRNRGGGNLPGEVGIRCARSVEAR